MTDFGICQKCGSREVVCPCMREKSVPAPKPVQEGMPVFKSAFMAQAMRIAGWHNDAIEQGKLFVAATYNSEQAKAFWEEGRASRAAGEHCGCRKCCRERRILSHLGGGI